MRRGFTLLEVLLAAIILGTGLAAILVSMSQSMRMMLVSSDLETAQEVMDLGEMAYPLENVQDPDQDLDVRETKASELWEIVAGAHGPKMSREQEEKFHDYPWERGALNRCFALVRNYLNPHGLFLFDVNTPYKFKNVYGFNDFVLDDPDGGSVCCWRNTYDEESGICDFDLTFFTRRSDGAYDRSEAFQQERCYTEPQLRRCLKKNGFEICGVWSDYGFAPFAETDERWYVAARKMG